MAVPAGPAAEGVRVAWDAVPASVRSAVEDICGAPITSAVTQRGGFSPGVAARVVCADGRRFFVKAVAAQANPDSFLAHRRESAVLDALVVAAAAGSFPVPRLYGTVDDGRWFAMVLQDVQGRQPALPWRADELAQVVAGLDRLAETLTPAPIAAPMAADTYADTFAGWRTLTASGADVDRLDRWSRRHLERLTSLEATWPAHADGQTLLHTDIRADNLLLTAGGLVVVDWPGACTGPPLLDLVGFAPSVTMQGGPDPGQLLRMTAAGAAADHGAVAALACALAGYFTQAALRPAPPGLPTLRAFQAAQGVVARRWVGELLHLR